VIRENENKFKIGIKMKSEKAYPYNLIDDLMMGEEFYSELNDDEIIREVEHIIRSLSKIYVINKHIPRKMQEIIHFRYVNGLTYREIGNILKISGGRVGQIKQKTLRILRQPSRLNRLILRTPGIADE